MNLNYRILWFDDSDEFYESLPFDYLDGKISDWGFIPTRELVTTPTDFLGKAPFTEYDLLVVDYNLQEHGHGQEFIATVREQQVFTEIIFYSSVATSVLWDAIRQHQLEGIFVATKDNIIDRIEKVGHHTVRKVLDLENVRGIVMAEVGDLDLLLDSIIAAAFVDLTDDKKKELYERFHLRSVEQHDKRYVTLTEFIDTPTVETMLGLCDSAKRWQNYQRLKRHHAILKRRVIGNYANDILWPRNCLAHGIPTREGNGSLVFRFQGKEMRFDDRASAGLRTKIIEYKLAFSEIRASLMRGG